MYRQFGPVRRVVQARIVGHDSKAGSTSSAEELKPRQPDLGQSNNQVLTAAAAASAAVAATQPFIKVGLYRNIGTLFSQLNKYDSSIFLC